ncbi:hypothetical protein GUJ93_ZPchr0009g1640 [Zizania palustris]|uniref:Auxin-responsive protein n=1 Tax=Zizania palustris TaxID=103762 RepID=A0A8J5RAX9_ZIZPA|nr:hypothetical protein GUJ93_ZPchr0009g1640 [Zizania palustris]
MISSKRIAQLAKKWRRMDGSSREEAARDVDGDTRSQGWQAARQEGQGHCVVCTPPSADGTRFEVPVAFLGTAVFGDRAELLKVSREEYGFSGDGRIVLPCDALHGDGVRDVPSRKKCFGGG